MNGWNEWVDTLQRKKKEQTIMKDKEYAGLNKSNCDVIVERNTDMDTYPYTVYGMTQWGLSDGTLCTTNWLADDSRYRLTEQIEGSNIYVKKER